MARREIGASPCCGNLRHAAGYVASHHITLHYITLHYITLRYITLRYITLHYIELHCIALHCIITFGLSPCCVLHPAAPPSFAEALPPSPPPNLLKTRSRVQARDRRPRGRGCLAGRTSQPSPGGRSAATRIGRAREERHRRSCVCAPCPSESGGLGVGVASLELPPPSEMLGGRVMATRFLPASHYMS